MKASFLKRMVSAIVLGIFAGLICTYLAASGTPGIWGSPLMWIIIVNRMTIGWAIAIAGVYTKHPVFGFDTPAYLRGAVFGVVISVQLAIGVFLTPSAWPYSPVALFWMTILAGAVYGSVIDIIATRVGGEGKELLWKK